MAPPQAPARLSPIRATLNSFANAYAVAVSARHATGVDHYVVATGDTLQPYRVTCDRPARDATVIARVA